MTVLPVSTDQQLAAIALHNALTETKQARANRAKAQRQKRDAKGRFVARRPGLMERLRMAWEVLRG